MAAPCAHPALPLPLPTQAVKQLLVRIYLNHRGATVGRDSELEQLRNAVLGEHKCAVVIGGPGEGKTRLALQLDEWEEFVGAGRFFLDLSGARHSGSSSSSSSSSSSWSVHAHACIVVSLEPW